MRNRHPVWSGFLLLIIGGVIGYGIGLGVEVLMTGELSYSGSVPSAFALLFAVTAFFFGLYGYRGITRGLAWQVLGTLIPLPPLPPQLIRKDATVALYPVVALAYVPTPVVELRYEPDPDDPYVLMMRELQIVEDDVADMEALWNLL